MTALLEYWYYLQYFLYKMPVMVSVINNIPAMQQGLGLLYSENFGKISLM